MPTVIPITEMQRNAAAVAAQCAETKQPIYLTRNGTAALVVMDAAAFDEEMALHHEVYDREMRVLRSIMRGREDELEGRTRSLDQARRDAAAARGQA